MELRPDLVPSNATRVEDICCGLIGPGVHDL